MQNDVAARNVTEGPNVNSTSATLAGAPASDVSSSLAVSATQATTAPEVAAAPGVEASASAAGSPVEPVATEPAAAPPAPQVAQVDSPAPVAAVTTPEPTAVAATTAPAEPIASLTAQPAADINQYTPLYVQAIQSIIQSQENIVGPVALDRARQVQGLEVDWSTKAVMINGDPSVIVDELVQQYEQLFGQISVEVCREAAHRFTTQLPADKAPRLLR